MSDGILRLSPNEVEMIKLGRALKAAGHGTLTVEYRNGLESLFTPAPKIMPPEVPLKTRC